MLSQFYCSIPEKQKEQEEQEEGWGEDTRRTGRAEETEGTFLWQLVFMGNVSWLPTVSWSLGWDGAADGWRWRWEAQTFQLRQDRRAPEPEQAEEEEAPEEQHTTGGRRLPGQKHHRHSYSHLWLSGEQKLVFCMCVTHWISFDWFSELILWNKSNLPTLTPFLSFFSRWMFRTHASRLCSRPIFTTWTRPTRPTRRPKQRRSSLRRNYGAERSTTVRTRRWRAKPHRRSLNQRLHPPLKSWTLIYHCLSNPSRTKLNSFKRARNKRQSRLRTRDCGVDYLLDCATFLDVFLHCLICDRRRNEKLFDSKLHILYAVWLVLL